jgi:hypothetical protein
VTCVTAEDCWAVGDTAGSSAKPLIEHYSGTRWVISANSGGSQLASVTCVSAQDCWAVGSTTTPPTGVSGTNAATSWPLIEHYKFSRWAIVGTAHPLPGELFGVTCVSAGDCWAVGGTGGNPPRPLIEHYVTGNWAVDPSYSPSLAQLNGVTCASAEDCWAVGGPADRSPIKTLIEHYSGTRWVISANSGGSQLVSVTCVSAQDCWAVGDAHKVSGRERLTEHYTGGSWAEDNAPEPVVFVEGDALFGMTCVSAADCWAVGSAQGINGFQVLIEHYALGKWLVITGPNLGP